MLHLPHLITDLGLILCAAGVTTLLFKFLKQPLVLGYIIAGFIIGPNFSLFPTISEIDSIRTWADIGVIFLLFSLGLEFSFKKLVKVGAVAAITAFIGVGATMILGYLTGQALGWKGMDSLFLGGILAIASTTIIIRAFEETGVKSQKFTGIVMGVLVVEDLVAIVLMVMLSTLAISRQFVGTDMIFSIGKLVFFLVLWFLAGIFFVPTFLKKTRKLMSDETVLVISIALCLLMVILATNVGFSPALGAFIMGSILAETTQAEKIEHLIKPVRDLFGAVFFVSVGMLIAPQMIVEHALPVIIATLVLLIGKPLFVSIGALLSGQTLKTSVQSGMSLSQIGEFSFIIATLGMSLNVTSDFLYPVAVAVSVITAFTTPYMIRYSEKVSKGIEAVLPAKWTASINRYALGAQHIVVESDWKKVLRSYAINVVIYSVLILTLILLSVEYLAVIFQGNRGGLIITAFITLVLMAPFLWALAFRRTQKEAYANIWSQNTNRGPLLMLQLSRIALALFYIGFLLDSLFSPWVALLIGLVIIAVLFVFAKKIKAFYGRIEQRFLNNLHAKENESATLAPWDAHLASFVLDYESPMVGHRLIDLQIREKFGINIAMIGRGSRTITAPGRDERLYPNDTLSVIGTDAQLETFGAYMKPDRIETNILPHEEEISLQQVIIKSNSPLFGKTIRESGIREQSRSLVAGIERDGERILNPESSMVFEKGDIVWLVGNERLIKALL